MINLLNLRIDFEKTKSEIRQHSIDVIKMFYQSLTQNENHTVNTLLNEWKNQFIASYGNIDINNSSNNKLKKSYLQKEYHLDAEDIDIYHLFFSIQTYFDLLIKTIAHNIVLTKGNPAQNLVADGFDLHGLYKHILSGEFFEQHNIFNFCHEDYFGWFLKSWNEEMRHVLEEHYQLIATYNTVNSMSEFLEINSNDNIKQLYETVIPKQIRHALGEYYTPDWLAEYTLEYLFSLHPLEESIEKSILDPTCGSGTFIFKAIQMIKSLHSKNKPISNNDLLLKLLNNVIGFDLNPLAITTCRTNYLISIIELLDNKSRVEIPVYHYDTINAPKYDNDICIVEIANHSYSIPVSVLNNADFFHLLKECVSRQISTDEFLRKFTAAINIHDPEILSIVSDLYMQVHASGYREVSLVAINLLENRIKAFQTNKVDIIAGNPPWVNWEYLPDEYKWKSQYLWPHYGLFSLTGKELAFSKEDISVLMTYVVMDRLLKNDGHLGFVIRQVVFKSSQNGVGFRRFKIGENGPYLKVLKVDDMVAIKPFDNASNSTAVLFLEKGSETIYPVDYHVWNKTEKGKLDPYSSLESVKSKVTIKEMIAKPAEQDKANSLWITSEKAALEAISMILGTNTYKARTGVFTGGANAVYWVQASEKLENGNIIVTNITERAKRSAEKRTVEMEPSLVYPLVRGSDVSKWAYKPSIYIICPHTIETKMQPIDKTTMLTNYPKTMEYLDYFSDIIDDRKGFTGWEKSNIKDNPYAIQRIGDYTFSKFKVAWKYIATEFICTVISETDDEFVGRKLILPNEKLIYVSTNDENEAYYLCGVLSSSPVSLCVKSFMNPTSISVHVLEKLNIPTFDCNNPMHINIAQLCKKGHQNQINQTEIQKELDLLVSKLYGITNDQLETIQSSL